MRPRRPHKLDKKTSVPRCHDKLRRPGAVLLLQPSSASTAVGTVCVLFRLLRCCGWIAVSRAPHLRPARHGWPYQEYKTPGAIALRIIGARKLIHYDKVVIKRKGVKIRCINSLCNIRSRFNHKTPIFVQIIKQFTLSC